MTDGGSRDKSGRDAEPSVEEILGSIKKIIAENDGMSAAAGRKRPRARTRDDDILDLDDAMIAREAAANQDDEDDLSEPMLTGEAEDSVRHSFAALAAMAEPGARPQIVRSGETSLESMVREMLRPMLKQWVDQNLPAMVEEVVAREIRRIGRGSR